MNREEARRLLDDAAVVPLVEGSLADVKRLAAACLEAGIPVDFGRHPGGGSG